MKTRNVILVVILLIIGCEPELKEDRTTDVSPWQIEYQNNQTIGIFGSDTRKRVQNQTAKEYHALGKLNLYVDETGERVNFRTFHCSATLIHPRFAITAAHCLVNSHKVTQLQPGDNYQDALFNPRDIEFNRAQSNFEKYEAVKAYKVYVDKRYLIKKIQSRLEYAEYDLGLIEFEYPLDSPFIPIIATHEISKNQKGEGKIAGYPFDHGAEKLYESSGDILVDHELPVIRTYLDLVVGMSGSALRVKVGKKVYVAGVLSQVSSQVNNITALNSEKIKLIQYWMNQQ